MTHNQERRAMTKHMTGTRKEWLAARVELLKAEKELTRRSDELARRRQELPWVRIDKKYRFETDEGSALLADLFRGRSQLLVYHYMFGPDYTAGCATCSTIADGFQERGNGRNRRGHVHAREAGHERVRARGRRRLPQLFHLCARTGRPLGHVPVARPRPQGAQRDGRLVAPARRVRQGLSEMSMSGQPWLGAAASFLGMWVVMMVAMMLPSLAPMLWRYRQAVGRTGETRLGRLTALVGVGYFFVWTVFGMAAFPLGVALAAVEMQQPALARAVPIAVGVVVLMAGSLQLTAWKARHLAYCREAPGRSGTLPADAGTAWRHGMRLGLHCSNCSAGLMAILLVIGVMDLRAMAVVAAAITVERLAPAGERVARATGAVAVGAGLFLIARAAGLG